MLYELLSFPAKMLLGIIIILAVFRFMGRKELAQSTPIDFLFIVIIGEMLGGITQDTDAPIWHVAYVIPIWVFFIWIFERITMKRKIQKAIEGEPKTIIQMGIPNEDLMKRESITDKELRTKLRQKGVFDLNEVELAVLELSGEISVKKR